MLTLYSGVSDVLQESAVALGRYLEQHSDLDHITGRSTLA
jgi:hypothetical protein